MLRPKHRQPPQHRQPLQHRPAGRAARSAVRNVVQAAPSAVRNAAQAARNGERSAAQPARSGARSGAEVAKPNNSSSIFHKQRMAHRHRTRSAIRFSKQQLRQLSDIHRDPSRLILAEQLSGRSPARLILEIDIGATVTSTRRFPPPWSVEEQEACFVVRDHNGQAWPRVNDTSARPLQSRTTSECGRWSAV
jgi:hypothetical protein